MYNTSIERITLYAAGYDSQEANDNVVKEILSHMLILLTLPDCVDCSSPSPNRTSGLECKMDQDNG